MKKVILSLALCASICSFCSITHAAEAGPLREGLQQITENTTYDLEEGTLTIASSCAFLIHDNCSLTIENAVIDNIHNHSFIFISKTSTLILKNVTLKLKESCYIQIGTIIIDTYATIASTSNTLMQMIYSKLGVESKLIFEPGVTVNLRQDATLECETTVVLRED
jgi:hypothetical protein